MRRSLGLSLAYLVFATACGDAHAERRQACAHEHVMAALVIRPPIVPLRERLEGDRPSVLASPRERRGTPISAGVPVSGEPLAADADEGRRERRREREAANGPTLAYVEAKEAFGSALDALATAQATAQAALGVAPEPTQAVDNPAARQALEELGRAVAAVRSAEARHLETARAFLTAIWPVLLRGYRESLEQLDWVADAWTRNPEAGSPLMQMMGVRLQLGQLGQELDGQLEREALRLVGEDWSPRPAVAAEDDVDRGGFSPYGQRTRVNLRGEALEARRAEVRWRIARIEQLATRAPSSLLRDPWRPSLDAMDEARTGFATSCADLPPP